MAEVGPNKRQQPKSERWRRDSKAGKLGWTIIEAVVLAGIIVMSTTSCASIAQTAASTSQASTTTSPSSSPATSAEPAITSPSTLSPTTGSLDGAAITSTPLVANTSSGQKVVCLDPGHQAHPDLALEPIGPGSKVMKPKVEAGTRGVVTRVPESELNLTIALKLRAVLEAHGVKVVMTRTTQNVNISNIQRAEIANAAHANLFVRIHANGNSNPNIHGIEVLYPTRIKGWTDAIAASSKQAAAIAEKDLVAATGAGNLGIIARSDITGFNWSKVPVILPEIGFMTNPTEDRLMETSAYQTKIVDALARAILTFISVH